MPLHIFEPRYKELIGECLENEEEFGLVLADDDGRREVGTRAAVIKVLQIFDDGRLNVVVEGRDRFRIVVDTAGRAFSTSEVEPVEDDYDPPADEDVRRALELFAKLVQVAEASNVDQPDAASEALSFEIGARIDLGPDLKQELLEIRSERERLERLRELMEIAIRGVSMEREVRKRAAGNGRVSRRLVD